MASSRQLRLSSTINLNLFSDEFLRKTDAETIYIERTAVEAAYLLITVYEAGLADLQQNVEGYAQLLASRNAGLIENLNRIMQEEVRKASAAAFFNANTFTGTT